LEGTVTGATTAAYDVALIVFAVSRGADHWGWAETQDSWAVV